MAGSRQTFIALTYFDWVEGNDIKAHYVKGLTYTAREGDAWDKLREQIPAWEAQGKIELVGVAVGTMEGKGD